MSSISELEQKESSVDKEFKKTVEINDAEKRMRAAATFLDKQKELLIMQSAIGRTVDLFTTHTIELADKQRDRKESWYRIVNYACWVLFAIGWILTRAGVTENRDAAEPEG